MKLSEQMYTQEFNCLKKLALRENPNLSDLEAAAQAHARHPWEQQAEQTARQAVARYKAAIDAGAWDLAFP